MKWSPKTGPPAKEEKRFEVHANQINELMQHMGLERLAPKPREIYLHAYDDLAAARRGIRDCFTFYSSERPHATRSYQSPRGFYDLMAKSAA